MTPGSTARVIGVLFIIATVAMSLSVVILEPVLESADYLLSVFRHEQRVVAATLLELTNHIAVITIAVVIYPIFRAFSERMAIGYIAARGIESVLFAIGTMHLIALASVSRSFSAAGAPPASEYQVLGDMLLAGHDWNHAVIQFTAFGLGALILNYLLFQTRLVPRGLSGFGLVAAALILTARILIISGIELTPAAVAMMDMPIMAQEMLFAAWLIVKGFDSTALEVLHSDHQTPFRAGT